MLLLFFYDTLFSENSDLKFAKVPYYHIIILVPLSTKRIATQIKVIAKLNERKYFILRGFVCDIICPSEELPVQS